MSRVAAITGTISPVLLAALLSSAALAHNGPPAAISDDGVDIAIRMAWDGRYRTGHFTEVAASWLATQGGEFSFALDDGESTVTRHAVARKHQPQHVALAFMPAPGRAPTARLTLPGGRVVERVLDVHAVNGGIGIVVDAAGPIGSDEVAASSDTLPITRQGYDSVGQIMIDTAALTRMSQPQLNALEAYLADCGTIVLAGAGGKGLRDSMASITGCGGRTLYLDGEARPGDQRLPLPGGQQLRPLLPDVESHRVSALSVAFVAFFVTLLLAAAAPRRRWPLVAVVLLGTAGVPMAARTTGAPTAIASWAEKDAGDRSARFSMRIRKLPVLTDSMDDIELPLPVGVGLPRGGPAGLQVEVGADGMAQTLRVGGRTPRPITVDFDFTGTFPVSPTLQLAQNATAQPVIRHAGQQDSPPSWLVWDDRIHAIPSLHPGATWTPDPASTDVLPDGALRSLLRTRNTGPALLIPTLPLDPAQTGAGSLTNGWLLVRYPEDLS
ncbi:MAG: hypothetical protein KDJ39_09790 [Gammaproteobacteria bacterium]|nr:hypothetical protein [Gammaproteobacteria bacterium]